MYSNTTDRYNDLTFLVYSQVLERFRDCKPKEGSSLVKSETLIYSSFVSTQHRCTPSNLHLVRGGTGRQWGRQGNTNDGVNL